MRKILFLLVALVTMTSACASDDWRSQVGLPTDCTNPVFTRPFRMNSSSRVEGAGICMNDGEAYTNRMVDFGSEWHYAPKLPLSKEETAVLPCVMGLYFPENYDGRPLEPLKFCARVHHGCGAVVVYRAFDNYRYTDSQSDNLEQFIAVYDGDGTLTDCMMMGYEGDLSEMLNIEPHKDYKVPNNMGNYVLEFDETGEHFTLYRYTYLRDKGEGIPDKMEMKRYYTITPEGKIRLDKVTNNSEGHDKDSKYDKPGAPMNEIANSAAVDMMELVLTPMSDPEILPKLDKIYAELLNNELVSERLMHLGMMIYNRMPNAFLVYAYKNRSTTSLVELLKRAKAYKGPGCEYSDCIDETIEKNLPLDEAQSWLKNHIK
jgi:hypothetical protein